jgi:hypothetical protein
VSREALHQRFMARFCERAFRVEDESLARFRRLRGAVPHSRAVPLAALTAWQGRFDHGGVKAGQYLLINN